jgi:hypothetical protein
LPVAASHSRAVLSNEAVTTRAPWQSGCVISVWSASPVLQQATRLYVCWTKAAWCCMSFHFPHLACGGCQELPVDQGLQRVAERILGVNCLCDDGRFCLTNNTAERELRGVALGRKSWLFAGSDRGGERAAIMYTLIQTAKLNGIDPQAWLAHFLTALCRITRARPLVERLET